MVTISELKDRWRGGGQEQARAAVERLLTGAPTDGLGLGEVDGRVDLRGLWLGNTKGLPGLSGRRLATTPTASGVSWSDLDLSRSTLRVDLDRATVDNVRFDRAGWQDWHVQSSVFRDCSFAGADLRDTKFDGGNPGLQDRRVPFTPSRYVRCDFTRTRTGPYGSFGRATLEECLFRDTAFPSPMWFGGADLHRCVFSGRFRTVCFGWTGRFRGRAPWLDADMSEAEFESLELYSHSGPGVSSESRA